GWSRKPSQKFALGESSSRHATMTLHHDTVVRPKERAAVILAQFDREMARIKECDHRWEDGMEASRSSPPRSNSDDSSSVPEWCASRVRHGRRGVLHIDRRCC
ncbi:hypothetical protein BJV77DRAFT_1036624, partial [Russula vinacea]